MIKNRNGFTLVELIVVIVILGILAVIAVPAYNSYTEKAKINKEKTNVAAAFSVAYAEAMESYALNGYVEGKSVTATSGTVEVTCHLYKHLAFDYPYCAVTGGTTYPFFAPILDGTPELNEW